MVNYAVLYARQSKGDTSVTQQLQTAEKRAAERSVIAAVVLAFFGVLLVASGAHSSATSTPSHAAETQPATTPSPSSAVSEYFAAINSRDWKKVWELQHGKPEPGEHAPYSSIAAGYRLTKRVVPVSMRTHGDRVSGRVLAYETTGPVQTYAYRYVVQHGLITHGWNRLFSTT